MMSSMKLHSGQKVGPGDDGDEGVRIVHLRTSEASFVVCLEPHGLPRVVHWGSPRDDSDLDGMVRTAWPAVVNSSFDQPRQFSLVATRAQGWSGTPLVEISADARPVERFETVSMDEADDGMSAQIVLRDVGGLAELRLDFTLSSGSVLEARATVENLSRDVELLVGAIRTALPLPARAEECLDFTGRWTGERRPQRSWVRDGTWARRAQRGRPGHDASFVTMVGTPHFAFRTGEVWAAHLGWSGDQEALVERLPEGAGVHSSVLSVAEMLESPGQTLSPGEIHETPTAYFAWSPAGIDGITDAFHSSLRSRPSHPRSPRPLVLNTWEAVYFDHDPARLLALADTAASIGVERFVLDDGWFRGRRDDRAGLGDWYVDSERWPEGLLPLSRRVHELGMQFGLWFEPEMVNLDSDLARSRADWILGEIDGSEWRHQFALDFSRPDVREFITDRLVDVIRAADVDFVKWDHNRDLHASLSADGRRRVREHTLGVYQVIDDVRRRYPSLEVESCASGGARIDRGILDRTDRVWASDSNDPIERQYIQRWTQTLLPPELVGAHVGPESSHTTQRQSSFALRAITALFGHAGIEWDISECTAEERASLAQWSSLYRELRPLIHSGRTVRADHVDDGALLHGVVSQDSSEAVFAWVRVETSSTAHTARVPFPGLDPKRRYVMRNREEVGVAARHQVDDPRWMTVGNQPIHLTGAVLAEGLPLPLLNPGQGMLFHLTTSER